MGALLPLSTQPLMCTICGCESADHHDTARAHDHGHTPGLHTRVQALEQDIQAGNNHVQRISAAIFKTNTPWP